MIEPCNIFENFIFEHVFFWHKKGHVANINHSRLTFQQRPNNMTKHTMIFRFICGLKLSIYHQIMQIRNDSSILLHHCFTKLDRRRFNIENILVAEGLFFGMKIGTRATASSKDTKRTDGLMVIMTLQPIIRSAFENTFATNIRCIWPRFGVMTTRIRFDEKKSTWSMLIGMVVVFFAAIIVGKDLFYVMMSVWCASLDLYEWGARNRVFASDLVSRFMWVIYGIRRVKIG